MESDAEVVLVGLLLSVCRGILSSWCYRAGLKPLCWRSRIWALLTELLLFWSCLEETSSM